MGLVHYGNCALGQYNYAMAIAAQAHCVVRLSAELTLTTINRSVFSIRKDFNYPLPSQCPEMIENALHPKKIPLIKSRMAGKNRQY